MTQLHVGRGTSRGPLTVFPLWGEYGGPRAYSLNAAAATLTESQASPAIATLVAVNGGERQLLLLEGQLLEGGWQNRMLRRSVLVPARGSVELEVVCVEAGRWHGGARHRTSGRRASMRVRNIDGAALRAGEQGEVWRRVSEYEVRFGANATSSFAEHAERGARAVRELVEGLRPLPGQIGVLIGIAGQPVMLEAFDSPVTLQRQFASIIQAAGLDALGQEALRTPARRAIRFVDRVALVRATPVAPAGAGTTVRGASGYAAVTGLAWRRHLVHLTASNIRHALNTTRVA